MRLVLAALAAAIGAFPVLTPIVAGAQAATEPDALPCNDGPYDLAFPCLADVWIRGTTANPQAHDSGAPSWLGFDSVQRDLYGVRAGNLIRWEIDTTTGIPLQQDRHANLLPRLAKSGNVFELQSETGMLFGGHLPNSTCAQGLFDQCTDERFRLSVTNLASTPPVPGYYQLPDPGIEPMAISVDAPRNRLYVLGGLESPVANDIFAPATKSLRIMAFDLAELVRDPGDTTGNPALVWKLPVPNCVVPFGYGGEVYLGVANDGTFLYFGCSGAKDSQVTTRTHGVVRITLGSSPGSLQGTGHVPDGAEFEYFPVAGDLMGSYINGHRSGERLIAMAIAAGPKRAFVFDARRGAWTGSRKLDEANVAGVAVDQVTGRAYVRDNGSSIAGTPPMAYLVDTGQLPPPQGQPIPLKSAATAITPFGVNGVVDPATRRVFLAYNIADRPRPGGGTSLKSALRVYQDRTPPYVPAGPATDPDSRTNDIDEEDAISVDFNGAASGYGARTLFVSPDSGVRTSVWGLTDKSQLEGSLLSATTDAGAVGLEFDDTTDEEFAFPINERAPSLCFDVTQSRTTSSHPGSEVVCDGARRRVTASAWSSDSNESSPVRIARSRTETNVRRLKNGGVQATATAITEGVEIGAPGFGALLIGEIKTIGTSVAKGRPGTARSTYTVSINNVKLVDRRGGANATLFVCGWDTDGNGTNTSEGRDESDATRADDPDGKCDPGQLQTALKRLRALYPLPFDIRAPKRNEDPEFTGSDGGARAINEKDPFRRESDKVAHFDDRVELPGLEVVLYHEYGHTAMGNGSERREIVQLAGVRTEAQYRIGPPAEDLPPLPPDIDKVPDEKASLSIVLTDPSEQPLAGGRFDLRTDVDGDGKIAAADRGAPSFSCATGADGIGDCSFELDPASYVIHQAGAPNGYEVSEDVPVQLAAGVHGAVTFVNAPMSAGVQGGGTSVGGTTTIRTVPVVYTAPREALPSTNPPQSALNRLLGLPADIAEFLRRNPGQAVLFALLWTLLGTPLYLSIRRRSLVTTKQSITSGAF